MAASDATPAVAGPTPAARGALRHPVMRAILAAEAVSALGTQMTFVALPWFVLTTTGSATRMGLVFAVELLPVALLGIPSALVVQRLGVRRTMFVSDLSRAPLLAAVPLLHLTDRLTFPLLLGIVFVVGVFSAPYLTAQRLIIPETFGDDEALVVQGNALLEGVIRLATLLGPAVAGVAISGIGAVNILYVDAATYLLAYLILVSGLPKPVASLAGAAAGEGRGVLAGARFVLAHPLLRRVTVAALLFGFFFPPLLASLPVLTEQRYAGDPRVVGLLYAAWGAGAVIGTFGVMRYATRMPPMRMGALGAAGVAIPLWLLVFPLPVWQFALVLLVSGLFTPMLNAPVITLIMLRTPAEMRAKVVTFVMTANLLAGPIAFSLTGPVLDRFGLTPVFLIVAIGVSCAAVVLMTMAGIRDESAQAQAEAAV
jgi:predicted MFS family arabinose efflux permease